MKKDRLICFRTGKDLYENLSRVAKKERRSLSSTIETILTNDLKNKKESKSVEKEKRQYPRQGIVAAVLNDQFYGDPQYAWDDYIEG